MTSVEELAVSEPVIAEPAPPAEPLVVAAPCVPRAPAFVPPNLRARRLPAPDAGEPEPPAFIPPDVVRQRHAHPSA